MGSGLTVRKSPMLSSEYYPGRKEKLKDRERVLCKRSVIGLTRKIFCLD